MKINEKRRTKVIVAPLISLSFIEIFKNLVLKRFYPFSDFENLLLNVP